MLLLRVAALIPTSAAKIKKYLEENKILDGSGNPVILSKWRITHILKICGYKFGAAGHHHVAKESPGNKVHRMKYCKRMKSNRDENGLPIQPEVYYDESYVSS